MLLFIIEILIVRTKNLKTYLLLILLFNTLVIILPLTQNSFIADFLRIKYFFEIIQDALLRRKYTLNLILLNIVRN